MKFKDRVAVITGGNSGIGRATALAFTREGAIVVIAARDSQRANDLVKEIEDGGGEALFVQTDVSKPDDIANLFNEIVKTYGRIDYAFNNAAAAEGVFKLTADFEESEFDRVMQTNAKGVWLCMKHEIQQMLRQAPPGGVIVNTSSVNGLGGAPQASLYSASKSSVLALTKSASQEYASKGIRINALVPGFFRTPMLENVFESASSGNPEAKQAIETAYTQMTSLGRIGRPEEAAAVAIWLCSEEASYVTGHSMIVDGGMTSAMR